MSARPPIIQRQVDIEFSDVPPGPWFPAGGPLETMFNAASLSFPPTERFFIAAVRNYQNRITEPGLADEVRKFIYQEAMHNKVHIDCNTMLSRGNGKCRVAEKVSVGTFRVLSLLPKAFRLSLSSALEHFTAMAADTLLQYPDAFCEIVPAPVAQMWLWHAAEETEHKAVCFDVHKAIFGSGVKAYLNRVGGMLLATPIFLFVLIFVTAAILSIGKSRTSAPKVARIVPTDPRDPARFLGRNMLSLLRELIPWRLYFSYYRPSFHPWDHDNAHYIVEWKQRYPNFGISGGVATV